MGATILKRPQVEQVTGLSRSTIYRKIQENTFPAPISLGARAVGWIESEVQQWIEEQINKSRVAN